MKGKPTVCKVCGGERDPHLANRMCRPCYNAYVRSLRREPYGDCGTGRGSRGEDWQCRVRVFRRVFERHGLRAGTVWAQVRAQMNGQKAGG